MDSKETDKISRKINQIQEGINQSRTEILCNLEQIADCRRQIRELAEKNRVLTRKVLYYGGQIEGLSDSRWLK